MFTELKARRIASRLVDSYPEISREAARARTRRILGQYPHLSAEYAADALIRGERTARLFERQCARASETRS